MPPQQPSYASPKPSERLTATLPSVIMVYEEQETSPESLQLIADHVLQNPFRRLQTVMSTALSALPAPSPGVGESKSPA